DDDDARPDETSYNNIMGKKKATEETKADAAPTTSAEYTVLARRYRPQQFSDLIGQEAVSQALTNALESGRVAHAYLFTGARGVGKTSAARILAKALNCVKGPTPTPCDECEICKAITSGEDTDVLEIDGASNTGVDNVRELRANVHFRPSRSRYKIYIIDEVHMLSTAAFNALLKTLEEPPAHVKFIFATTDVHKIPITVLSRCQRFDFGNISTTRILERLKGIVASEGMEADDEALETVARRANGSMRDGQSLLDQLLAFSGKKLTVDSVNQLLGTAHEERVVEIAGAVVGRDPKKALAIVSDIVDQGQQLGELLDQLIEYWRDLMVVNSAGLTGQTVSISSSRRPILEQHAKAASLDTILAGMDILVTAKTRMRTSSHARALLELALVRMCQLDDLVPISQIAQWLNKDASAAPPKAKIASPTQPIAASAPAEKKKVAERTDAESGQAEIPITSDSISTVWQQVLTESGFAIQAELRRGDIPAISGPNTLVMPVSRRYNAPGSIFADNARLAKVQELLSRIAGASWTLRVEWVEDAPESTSPRTSPAAQAMGQQRIQRAEMMQIPFVKRAADVLGAQIMRADEGFGSVARNGDSETADETPATPEEE
ncbi:MAG TPA: DNA polymerase III subunit gamma/tau, partial [Gemmataceae bacterium]|nr:DNA polymerase III subunit gamma/tau [Gemmataceae bacterium]